MKKLLWIVVLAVAVYAGYQHRHDGRGQVLAPATVPFSHGGEQAAEGDRHGGMPSASHAQVQGSGVVVRILPDDEDGSRHQRFILRTPSGQTLLVAHNIDLAPRVSGLSVGDTVDYSGEYVRNAKGGVVHWTHHDPSGRHVAGWLKHAGQTYQ
jgi:hypothetical protein